MEEITIIGSGAMALYFGGRLAAAGVKVQLLGTWEAGIEAVRRKGICLQEEDEMTAFPARAAREGSELAPVRLALVLVKSWQTKRAASQLASLLAPDGIALTLQNGLGNAEILRKALGEERTAQGVTTYGATLVGPGVVRPGGEGLITVPHHPGLVPLIRILKKSGLNVRETADLASLVWGKLAINVAINPLTALLEVKNGQLLDSPAAVEAMGLAASEAAAVAGKLGIQLAFEDPTREARAVAEATSSNVSSMLQDIRRGAPTEIEALCGEVHRRGDSIGLPTPINQLLYLLVKAKTDLIKDV